MKIDNAVALVTGANRGIGLAFTRALLARGARKVYAGARDPSTVKVPGVEPVRLDVTKPDEVAAVAARARDVTLVINNAGVGQLGGFLAPDSEESARRHLETNFFGMLRMSHAFAPVLAANGGGALLNVLSIVWSLTNALRHELAAQRTQVLALHMAFVDTDLVRALDGPKASPDEIVARALDGLEDGLDEVLADERTRLVKQGLTAARPSYLPQLA
jgi:NAD(P)-dependent dehydrogenase (short-subunit alcohol dehydrogenase family)